MPRIEVAALTQVQPGTVLEVNLADNTVAVCNISGTIHCVDGICPHAGGPLGEGAIHGSTLVCPWHAWEFNLLEPDCGLTRYPVSVQDNRIFIELP